VQQPQQYRLAPGQAMSASTSPTNNMNMNMPQHMQQQQQFPKSHSIDNLPLYQQPVSYNNNNNLWNQQNVQQADLSNSQSPLDNTDMSINLHKKLQRQLSLLNPYDPRLYPMQQQQRFHNSSMPPPQGSQNHEHFLSTSPAHKQLQASHSLTLGGNAAPAHSIYEHQVSRNSLLTQLSRSFNYLSFIECNANCICSQLVQHQLGQQCCRQPASLDIGLRASNKLFNIRTKATTSLSFV
jgi:hypothetical protein